MTISRAGFFRELPHGLPDGESLRAAVASAHGGRPDEEQLLDHLWGNTVLAATAALVDDVIDPSATGVAPLEMVTDGTWVWPRDLAYYVQRYHVTVPLPFSLHLELSGWRQPALSPDDLDRIEAGFLRP